MKNINVITLDDAKKKRGCKPILFIEVIASKLGNSCTWLELLDEVGNSFLCKNYEVMFTIGNWWWIITEIMDLNRVDFDVWVDFAINNDAIKYSKYHYSVNCVDWDDVYIDSTESVSDPFELAKDFAIYLNQIAENVTENS